MKCKTPSQGEEESLKLKLFKSLTISDLTKTKKQKNRTSNSAKTQADNK